MKTLRYLTYVQSFSERKPLFKKFGMRTLGKVVMSLMSHSRSFNSIKIWIKSNFHENIQTSTISLILWHSPDWNILLTEKYYCKYISSCFFLKFFWRFISFWILIQLKTFWKTQFCQRVQLDCHRLCWIMRKVELTE